ncbi:MAG: flagellar hook-length control protein FliK [Rhodospirillales bacterium]
MDITLLSPSTHSSAAAVAASGTTSPDAAGGPQFSAAIAALLGNLGQEGTVDRATTATVDVTAATSATAAPTDPTLLLLAGLLVPGLQQQPASQPAPTLDPALTGKVSGDDEALLAETLAGVEPTTSAGPEDADAPEAAHPPEAAHLPEAADAVVPDGPTPQIAAPLAPAQLLAAQSATAQAAAAPVLGQPTQTDARAGIEDALAGSAKKAAEAAAAPAAAASAEEGAPAPAQAGATKPQGELQVKGGGETGPSAAAPSVDPGNRGSGGQGTSEDRREATARAETVNAALRGADGAGPVPHADFTAHLKAVQQGPQPPVHALDQIAVKINRAVSDQQDQISFQLRPGDLGRIDVKLEFTDGRMRAAIVVENPQTLDLLQRDARSLERALGDAGVKTDAGGLSFSLREDPRQAFAGREDARSGGGRSAPVDDERDVDAATAAMVTSYVRVGNGRVDVRI